MFLLVRHVESAKYLLYFCGYHLILLTAVVKLLTAVQEHQKQCIQATCDDRFKKEPLYPLHCFQTFMEADMEVLRGTTSPAAKAPSYPVNDQPPKKTLAAALVERTKK